MLRKSLIALAAGSALVSTAAMAAVTFDYDLGTGFVGKGDVQVLYGWNNAQAQTNLPSATFAVVGQNSYAVTCEWETGVGTRGYKLHIVTQNKTTAVNSTVAVALRKNKQADITGINLTGYGTTNTNTPTPVVGGSCLGEGVNGEITAVDDLGGTGDMLTVTWGGITYDLPNTPVI